jgi:hypothetical protein
MRLHVVSHLVVDNDAYAVIDVVALLHARTKVKRRQAYFAASLGQLTAWERALSAPGAWQRSGFNLSTSPLGPHHRNELPRLRLRPAQLDLLKASH